VDGTGLPLRSKPLILIEGFSLRPDRGAVVAGYEAPQQIEYVGRFVSQEKRRCSKHRAERSNRSRPAWSDFSFVI